jgi:hypothetical protein
MWGGVTWLPSAADESVMVVVGQPDEKRFWKCTMSWNMFCT